MRALAEFIMRGRPQAVLIAILGLPLISHTVLSLVTLRRGAKDGFGILLWSFAPYILLSWGDEQYLAFSFVSVGMLLTIYIGALSLRSGYSWSVAIVICAAISVFFGVLFLQIFDAKITEFLQGVVALQESALEARGQEFTQEQLISLENTQIVGVSVFGVAINCVAVLVLGRWWQSLLYNPGGFKKEFSHIRLSQTASIVCGFLLTVCVLFAGIRDWAWVAGLPFVMVSITVAHQFAAVQKMGFAWLVVFYIALINLPFYLAMAALGFADTWMDLRKKLLPKKSD